MKYTVVLRRKGRDNTDIYVAHVIAGATHLSAYETKKLAVTLAVAQASDIDNMGAEKGAKRKSSKDYTMLVMFTGWCDPIAWGFEPGFAP